MLWSCILGPSLTQRCLNHGTWSFFSSGGLDTIPSIAEGGDTSSYIELDSLRAMTMLRLDFWTLKKSFEVSI